MIFRFIVAIYLLALVAPATAQTTGQFVDDSLDGTYVFFQQGIYPSSLSYSVGLPPSGVIKGLTNPGSSYLLQPYTQDNVLLLQAPSARANDPSSGRLTLSTPTPAQAISIATTSGFGANFFDITVHFSNGTPDETFNSAPSPDWQTGHQQLPDVLAANARVIDVGAISNTAIYQLSSPGSFEIYALNLQLALTAPQPISSIDFSYVTTT